MCLDKLRSPHRVAVFVQHFLKIPKQTHIYDHLCLFDFSLSLSKCLIFFLGIWTFGYIWDITSNYLKLKFFRSQNKTRHRVFLVSSKIPWRPTRGTPRSNSKRPWPMPRRRSPRRCRVEDTLQWTEISHLGKRNILLKRPLNMGINMGIC